MADFLQRVVGVHANAKAVSPDDANEIDLAANEQGAPASDALLAAATAVKATNTETTASADKPASGAAVVSQTPSGNVDGTSWLLQVMAALGTAVAIGAGAWFLIGSAPLRRVSVSSSLNAHTKCKKLSPGPQHETVSEITDRQGHDLSRDDRAGACSGHGDGHRFFHYFRLILRREFDFGRASAVGIIFLQLRSRNARPP